MVRKYIKGDGNGGVNVNKSFLTIITLFILVLSTCASVVAYSVGVKNTADLSLNKAEECQEILDNQEEKIHINEQNIAVSQSQYEEILRRLERIENKI